jgi:hypothetical protein
MSNEKLKKFKQEIHQLTKRREQLLEHFFSKEKMIIGSFMETTMRCGTSSCHCHKTGGHPTVRISRWVDGKLKSKIVGINDREWVARAAAIYKACKQAMSEITKINARESEVLKLIVMEKGQIYE